MVYSLITPTLQLTVTCQEKRSQEIKIVSKYLDYYSIRLVFLFLFQSDGTINVHNSKSMIHH